jgi:hypothetical protein
MILDRFIEALQRRREAEREGLLPHEEEEDHGVPPTQPLFSVTGLVEERGPGYITHSIGFAWEEFLELFNFLEPSLTQKGRGRRRQLEQINRFCVRLGSRRLNSSRNSSHANPRECVMYPAPRSSTRAVTENRGWVGGTPWSSSSSCGGEPSRSASRRVCRASMNRSRFIGQWFVLTRRVARPQKKICKRSAIQGANYETTRVLEQELFRKKFLILAVLE